MSLRSTHLTASVLWVGLVTGALAGAAAEPPPAKGPAGAIRLNFKDASLEAVLQHLSEASGMAVISEAPVEGRITVVSRQDMNVDDTIALLDAALREKGYAAIRTGRVLKIVTLAKAMKANYLIILTR